jgi:DNA topoisomerase-1
MSTKTLVIVESPHKASLIQSFLGADYIVMSSKGHITELAKGGKFGLGVDINNNFKPRYVLMSDKIKILDDLMKTAKKCSLILLASDNDREGESISWHLQSRLEDVGVPIKRIVFNEIKKSTILKSLSQTRDVDLNLFQAQEARRILDRIVGFMASPFLITYFGPHLSAGRVQSVVTRMIIDRELEIESFVPEDFWTIQVNLSSDNKEGFLTKYSDKLNDEKSAKIIASKLNNKEYVVAEVVKAEEKKYPFPPLVTSTLQRVMSKDFGFSPDRTMKAAQSLYENGYCTYIRTDSTRISDEAIKEARQWLQDNKYLIPKKPNIYKTKDTAQDAHECIRPTDISLEVNNITDADEKKVYEIIWKHFIASQMNPAIYNTLKVTLHVKGDKTAEVKTAGKAIKSKGYLDIFGMIGNEKIDIPNLNKGDIVYLFGDKPIKIEKKQTQPLPRYSEDKLIKELDNKGIGRPSTYAELLSKITSRNYVEKKGNVYHATDLGKKVTNVLLKFFSFMNYDFTSLMELNLDKIEHGKISKNEILSSFYKIFSEELKKAYLNNCKDKVLCKKCGNLMIKRMGKYGSFYACVNNACKNTEKIPQ